MSDLMPACHPDGSEKNDLIQQPLVGCGSSMSSKKGVERTRFFGKIERMTETVVLNQPAVSVDEIQQGWHDLKLRVGQLEADRAALEQENKALRFLLERVIEHRQKSHCELVLLLSGLVSKLPINDVGVIVSRLVEHNAHVSEICAALAKGKIESALPQPAVLKALDQTKRELAEAAKGAVEALMQLNPPLEKEMLESLVKDPELFFAPKVVRANRCFLKGQLPKERVLREFGEPALAFFNDLTTDPKLNPRPKPDEIVLAFKNEFEQLCQQNPALIPDKRKELQALHEKVQRSKGNSESARAQKVAFARLSFILDLFHYYENQNTESPEAVFAQRLPVLIEQLALPASQDSLEEKSLAEAESLLAFILSHDYRLMVINNVGKGGGLAKTLKFVLRLRAEKSPDQNQAIQNEVVPEFVRQLIPTATPPPVAALVTTLKLIQPELQLAVARFIRHFDKIRKEEAEVLGKALVKELNLTGVELEVKAPAAVSSEVERQRAWENIKELITRRADPVAVAAAVRDRLHAKYDADEVRQSWITLTEADPISLIRVFCHLPYLADGRTDPVARAVMETYITRLTHEKYSAIYHKVVNSLKNMFKANANSPTLLNFLALVKWLDPQAATKLHADIGMPATA